MPNQVSVPFKKTYTVEIRRAVREYIFKNHTDTHPDAFRWDISRWESLRKDGVGGVVHVDRVKSAISYHAQLVFILTKLPADIGLEIAYAPVFAPNALPVTLSNLIFERAGVLFNLGALFSQLAAAEDRSTAQGLKQAIAYYQSAAGTWRYLASSVVPQLRASVAEDDMPEDLTEAFVTSLESLMLAQAQECVWQRAVMDNYKNGLIAKLSMKVSSFYGDSLTTIRGASSIRHVFPSHWLAHLETKQLHFEAAAHYRKSVEDLEASRYGHEIARLTQAQAAAKKGNDIARRGGVTPSVFQDVKSLLDTVQKNSARAERDNDLIYHQDVPSSTALPQIQGVSMIQSSVHTALTDPKTVIGDDGVIFAELLGWGARVAIDIYNDRRQNWIKEEVLDRAQQLDDVATKTLESLNLPAALEALERPVGLPPSLLQKAEEVRTDDGPTRIETSTENVRKLAQQDMDILNEAMDILDQEAEEDEAFRAEAKADRPPSHESNKELTAKAERYRSILDQASESDEHVRQKWDEWEKNIVEFTWDEAQLEASIPSSTVSLSRPSSRSGTNPTQTHARALRVLLESLDDVTRKREDHVRRATRLAESEDITSRIIKAANAIEQWVEVQPARFEDVLEEELAKYNKFRVGMEETARDQGSLLQQIKERNELFLQSRREDTSIKEREHALQSLDLAYHKYKEITRNLDEGLKFYNDFATILTQFRDTCKDWVNMRKREIHNLTRVLSSVTLTPPATPASPPGDLAAQRPEEEQPPAEPPRAPVLGLPPPDSDEWESMELPPAPALHNSKHRPRG
ncbi:BRO1-domain-containing protein [Rhodofomes roseus]|uniref:BRO1-domain-containing protein n=1 Tax=Rhodofomes roseus TaxID=34475 RepID=A0ABQ8KJF8_9APHY|nr:BRO1-domain-containing protein [Rhodofomes roseus]KAH9838254.1 BRO1-domain-containing protein [Rhodofomes roseus]